MESPDTSMVTRDRVVDLAGRVGPLGVMGQYETVRLRIGIHRRTLPLRHHRQQPSLKDTNS